MPIQVLSPQLANQIAAGEVVERPASVVKELVENSLDAGATRIDIDIERGGAKLIRIRDNGCGIAKDELALALARHATSKISSLDDLEAIISLGFRGEALASISSVSRLTLTSRTAEQEQAWQAYAEGRDMVVDIKPVAHPVGSCVEVLDLFYNTPARRKFLRTEKTEFAHIDELIRRIALARLDVSINLQHNGKIIRQYRAAKNDEQSQDKRLTAICGVAFMQHALTVSWQHGDLAIKGWIVSPQGIRDVGEVQYCYVNGRIIRDKLINHAIRQAYQAELGDEQQPAYVLYIDVDPHQVDVNVHPAKHEVRFHQSRLVHDFICQAVMTALKRAKEAPLLASQDWQIESEPLHENRQAAGRNSFTQEIPKSAPSLKAPKASTVTNYSEKRHFSGSVHENTKHSHAREKQGFTQETAIYAQLISSEPALAKSEFFDSQLPDFAAEQKQNKPLLFPEKKAGVLELSSVDPHVQIKLGKVLMIWSDCYAVVEYQNGIGLLSLRFAEKLLRTMQLQPTAGSLKSQPLLIPLRLMLSEQEKRGYLSHQSLLDSLGIEVKVDKAKAEIRAVPLPLRQQNLQQLMPDMFNFLGQQESVQLDQLVDWLAGKINIEHNVWNLSQAIQVLSEVERLCQNQLINNLHKLIQPIDMQNALSALENE